VTSSNLCGYKNLYCMQLRTLQLVNRPLNCSSKVAKNSTTNVPGDDNRSKRKKNKSKRDRCGSVTTRKSNENDQTPFTSSRTFDHDEAGNHAAEADGAVEHERRKKHLKKSGTRKYEVR